MLAHSTGTATLTIAALALTGSLALSQQPPAQPAPSAAPAPPAGAQAPAPPPHHMHSIPMGGMRPHGPMMQHGGFHGGSEGYFPGGMEMGGFHVGPAGMWWKSPLIVERLSLTADQTRKMDDIVEHSRLDLIDLRANLEKQQVMLRPLMDANPVDAAKASAQIDKVANARADLEKANAKMLLSIRGVLTPEQWTKLHEPPTPPEQGTAPSGGAGAAGGPPAGAGRWHGGRPGVSAGPSSDFAPPINAQ